jgi:hypothetical protein
VTTLTIESLRNPNRKTGFARVNKHSDSRLSKRYRAQIGAGPNKWRAKWRATAEEAAQDYIDHINGNETAAAPATYVFGGRAVSTQRTAVIPARPPTEANLRHNLTSSLLEQALIAEYGKDNVRSRSPTADGTEIDAVVRLPSGLFQIYEIKEEKTAKLCIREGLGQLLEYAKSPGMTAAGITVVGTVPPTREDALYLDRLNKDHCLNINYRQVNDAV